MSGDLEISLDKLPVRRLDAIEENGVERFPSSEEGYDEKRVKLIRRIDFAWAVEREDQSKKPKTEGETTKEVLTTSQQQGQWQSLVENLKLAQEELSVIIDLINTVEANDAVTVAGMTRPKQLPNEHLSDLAVSTATKLQCFKNLGKYFKQSAKALERQVAREARFYGALIRLQRNWKIKRHRLVAAASGNEGYFIDLFDSSLYDSAVLLRPSSLSTIPIDHDAAGMLTVNLPRSSGRSLQFEIIGSYARKSGEISHNALIEDSSEETKKPHANDDERVKDMHLTLREVHQTIHDEQVFDLVNREACNPSLDVYLSGMRKSHLHISIGQGTSVSISLVSSGQDDESATSTTKTSHGSAESFDRLKFEEGVNKEKQLEYPDQRCFEIYLRQLYHEYAFVKAKTKALSSLRSQVPGQPHKDNTNILAHFGMSLSHRILSKQVSSTLENLVSKTPYVHLTSHPTWNSRMSSWTLYVKLPQSILLANRTTKHATSPLWTKVVVIDDSITVEGEGAPTVVGLFEGKSKGIVNSVSRHKCGLADLPMLLLQQIASQIIHWLHEESLIVGVKTSRDFLSLAFELDRGDIVRLVAHVDPKDYTKHGCISWWLTMDNGLYAEEHKLGSDGESESRKYLGYLPLDVLYNTMLDFLNMCSC